MSQQAHVSRVRHKVIVDCDPGNGIPGSDVDDGLAIALLAGRPDVDVLGITVVAGNTAVEDGYASAHQICESIGLDVPIVSGAWRALLEDPQVWVRRRSRADAEDMVARFWDGVAPPSPRTAPVADDAAGFIVEQAHRHAGELVIVAVGPLTNLAMALQREARLPELVRKVYIMGGSFDVRTHPQELNFAVDPDAAQMVVRSGLPIVLVPLDVTLQTVLVEPDMYGWGDSAAADYLRSTTAPWIKFVQQHRRQVGCPLHDPLAAAMLVDPDVGTVKQWCVDVETVGAITRARPVAWPVTGAKLGEGLRLPDVTPIEVMETVDNDRLLAVMGESVRGLPRRSSDA